MKFASFLSIERVIVGCLCAGALVAAACADGRGFPTSPSASVPGGGPAAPANEGAVRRAVTASVAARSGELHVTKECSKYTFLAGSFCTITSSNVEAIEVGSRVVYAQAAGPASLDSDIVLDLPEIGRAHV